MAMLFMSLAWVLPEAGKMSIPSTIPSQTWKLNTTARLGQNSGGLGSGWRAVVGKCRGGVKAECGDPLCKEQRLLLLDLVEDRWYFPCMSMALICLVLGCICAHVYVWVCVPACIHAYVYVCQRVTSVIGPLV